MSDRIVAVQVTSSCGTILVADVYMPVDYGDTQSLDEYISEIGCLEGVDDYDEVIILGDFNSDLRNEKNRMSRRLVSFITDWNLTAVGLNDLTMSSSTCTWHRSD